MSKQGVFLHLRVSGLPGYAVGGRISTNPCPPPAVASSPPLPLTLPTLPTPAVSSKATESSASRGRRGCVPCHPAERCPPVSNCSVSPSYPVSLTVSARHSAMALQLPPKSASAVFEGPRQGPDPVTPGKDGGDGSMEWYPKTRPSSSRRNAVLLTVAVAVVAMGTLTVGFAILQETRLQRQELMMLELKNRILVLENQLHLKSVEEGGTQGHTPPDPSSEFLQSVTRFPGLAPQANQTREAGRDYGLSRYKRNAHKRGKKDKGKKKKNKEKKNNGKKNQRNRCRNCDVVERMIDCKLQSVRLLHAATRLAGLEQNQEPLDDDTFQWTGPDESYFEHSFELIRNYRNYVTGIKVYKRGVYHIYSQVALRGLYYPPDTRERVEQLQCGHVTVVQRGPTEIILMKSLTAQIQSVPSPATEDGELYPIDTALHVGDFILNEGDTVVVKRPRNCRNVRYHADPHFTYFGVNKLHDLSSSAVDCSL